MDQEYEAIARCYQIVTTHDEEMYVDKTLGKLHDGYRQAMQTIVLNPVFNSPLFNKSSHTDKEEERGRSTHRKEKERKRDKSNSPSPNPKGSPKKDSRKGENKARSVCNGCGSWKTETHTEDSCPFIRDKIKGYNPDYGSVPWEDSEAGKALKAKGHDFLRKPREDTSKGNNCMECLSISLCDTCHANLNFLNNNPSNLPFINAILFSQEKRTAKEKEERRRRVRPHEARPLLDTGASGDFISMEFADFLIKENFKIEKLNSSCNVSLASHDNCLKAHNYIKFELEIIDEFGTSDKLEIKGVIVPMKHGIIIGLPTMKRYNLTYRYPTIFANEKMQEELLCKPCNLEISEGDGNLHARRVVTSSTYPKEAIESEKGVEPVSDSEHPVQQDDRIP